MPPTAVLHRATGAPRQRSRRRALLGCTDRVVRTDLARLRDHRSSCRVRRKRSPAYPPTTRTSHDKASELAGSRARCCSVPAAVELSADARRYTGHEGARWHIGGDDGACCDDPVGAHRDALQDGRAGPAPHVPFNHDRCGSDPSGPLKRLHRVTRRQEADVGPRISSSPMSIPPMSFSTGTITKPVVANDPPGGR